MHVFRRWGSWLKEGQTDTISLIQTVLSSSSPWRDVDGCAVYDIYFVPLAALQQLAANYEYEV